MIPKKRRPTSPGEVLREEFLGPMKMTQGDLAERMGVVDDNSRQLKLWPDCHRCFADPGPPDYF